MLKNIELLGEIKDKLHAMKIEELIEKIKAIEKKLEALLDQQDVHQKSDTP